MKLYVDLKADSPQAWVDAVMGDFDSFLQDHADCERKASSLALSLVAKYPDKVEIIPDLIDTAVEELEHFQQVYQIMESRGIQLQHEIPGDPYIKQMLKILHSGRVERFRDRLLLASIVEIRGAERFRLIYEALPEGDLKKFYHALWASEAKHGNIYVKMALNYFEEQEIYDRLDVMVNQEAEIMLGLEIRSALH